MSVAQALLTTLRAPDSPHSSALLNLLLEHAMSEQIETFVDPDALYELLVEAMKESAVSYWTSTHVLPSRSRLEATLSSGANTVGEILRDGGTDTLVSVAAKLEVPDATWLNEAIDPAAFRDLLAPVLQELLLNFVKKLPVPGAGTSGNSLAGDTAKRALSGLGRRLKSQVSERAGKAIEAGRGVLGGLGAELERQAQEAARDFSKSASQEFRSALIARLRSDEGQAIVATMAQAATRAFTETAIEELLEDQRRLPIDAGIEAAPALSEALASHPILQQVVKTEVEAFLALEGEKTVGELLDHSGLRHIVHSHAQRFLLPTMTGFLASDAFGDWLTKLVDEAGV